MKQRFPCKSVLVAAALSAGMLMSPPAQAQPHHDDHGHSSDHDHSGHHGHHGDGYPPPPYHHAHTTVVIDRSRGGWWRGDPRFAAYQGVRRGYYFAPGYGYYRVAYGYAGRPFIAGVVLPAPMLRFIVVEPTAYGLRPPAAGYDWYYAGNSFVLASVASGIIVQAVAGGW